MWAKWRKARHNKREGRDVRRGPFFLFELSLALLADLAAGDDEDV